MLLEKIYDNVYVALNEETQKDDYEMSDKLTALLENVDLKNMDEKGVADLVCKASIIGQKQGFLSGVHFLARLFCEILS